MDKKKTKRIIISISAILFCLMLMISVLMLNACSSHNDERGDPSNNKNSFVVSEDNAISNIKYTVFQTPGKNDSLESNKSGNYSLTFEAEPKADFALVCGDFMFNGTTKDDGSFSIFGLAAGTYTLSINGKNITIVISDDNSIKNTNESYKVVDSNSSDIKNESAFVDTMDENMEASNISAIVEIEMDSSNNVEYNYAEESTETDYSSFDDAIILPDNSPSKDSGTTNNSDKKEENVSKQEYSSGATNSDSNKKDPVHNCSYTIPIYKSVLVQNAYDEKILVKDAWTEQVLVEEAYDEYIDTGITYVECYCGAQFDTYDEYIAHVTPYMLNADDSASIAEYEKHQGYSTNPKYDVVHHDSEYKTVQHPAEYKIVHHDAVYEEKTVGYKCSCGKEK